MRKYSLFGTRSVHRLQLETMSGSNWRDSTVSGRSTHYLQGKNKNKRRLTKKSIASLTNCKSRSTSIASREALQLQVHKHFGCTSANTSVAEKKLCLRLIATREELQLQVHKHFSCNSANASVCSHKKASYATNCKSTSTLVATPQTLQLLPQKSFGYD
jgi:RES domain-containing protein